MKIRIKAKNERGIRAIEKAIKDSKKVLAKVIIISESEIHIVPRGIPFLGNIYKNPALRPYIINPMVDMMTKYGAKKEDYKIKVI
jgi:hypothetical protein